MAAVQSDGVPFAVAHEGRPLGVASFAQEALGVDEDLMGLSKDLHAAISQAFDGGSHICDAQIEESIRCACFQEQAHPADVKESQAGGLEAGEKASAKNVAEELDCSVQVSYTLRDLHEFHHGLLTDALRRSNRNTMQEGICWVGRNDTFPALVRPF